MVRILTIQARVGQCQNHKFFSSFLNNNTEFKDSLHPDDRVCYACYRSHLVIVKHNTQSVQSTDSELQELISKIKCSLPNLTEIKKYENALDYVVRSLAISLGDALLKQTAMLLPQLYAIFRERLVGVTGKCGISICQDLPSHSWLRSQLSSLLEHHMAYRCSVPKYGTLLYRYGGI